MGKMKLIGGLSLTVLFVSFVLGGGAQGATTGKPTPANIIYTTQQPGTTTYDTAVALSTVINKHSYIRLTIQSITSLNVPQFNMLEKGETQLGSANSNSTYEALSGASKTEGTGSFAGKARPWVRILNSGQKLYFGWITRPDTGIKTILGLKGKKVIGNFPTLVSNTLAAFSSLRAYGLNPEKDVVMIKGEGTNVAYEKLQDKELDAIHSSLGGAQLMALKAAVGSFMIPFEANKVGVVSKAIPGMVAATMPGTYPGADVDTPCYATIIQVACHQNLSDELAYEFVKVIYDNEKELAAISPLIAEWNLKNAAVFPDKAVPYHPGAIKYYKEKKIWTSEHEARQKELLTALPK